MIADIYMRLSTSVQVSGDGFRRQESMCREACNSEKFTVRNVIKDVISAWDTEKFFTKSNLVKSIDKWRKYYWHNKGEPIDLPGVIMEKPPDYLVVESMDRLCRGGIIAVGMLLGCYIGGLGIGLVLCDKKLALDSEVVKYIGSQSMFPDVGISKDVEDGTAVYYSKEFDSQLVASLIGHIRKVTN